MSTQGSWQDWCIVSLPKQGRSASSGGSSTPRTSGRPGSGKATPPNQGTENRIRYRIRHRISIYRIRYRIRHRISIYRIRHRIRHRISQYRIRYRTRHRIWYRTLRCRIRCRIRCRMVRGPYGHLRTFGGIQWEFDLFNGRPKARCYPFNIVGHRFRDKTLR